MHHVYFKSDFKGLYCEVDGETLCITPRNKIIDEVSANCYCILSQATSEILKYQISIYSLSDLFNMSTFLIALNEF